MPKPPTKTKAIEDYTPDDHFRAMRGETIFSEEYRRYRNDGLRALGLDDEVTDDPDDVPSLESMTPDDHLDALRRR